MSEIYNKFNSLNDQQRFDIWSSIQGEIESYARRGTRSDTEPVVCVKVDANWEWGMSGAGQPHRNLYLIGHLYRKPSEDYSMSWMPIPKGGSHGKYGHTGIKPEHHIVIEDEQAFESLVQEKILELEKREEKENAPMNESINVNRWGKLAGLIKG